MHINRLTSVQTDVHMDGHTDIRTDPYCIVNENFVTKFVFATENPLICGVSSQHRLSGQNLILSYGLRK